MDAIFEIESQESFRKVSEEIINNLYGPTTSVSGIENTKITSAKAEFQGIILSCGYDIQKIKELLLNKQYSLGERMEWFLSTLQERTTELLYAALLYHSSIYGEAMLDFDWCLKIVFGTSESKILRYPILQLLISVTNENKNKQVTYDIKKDVLKKLITVLESIDTS